MDELEKVIKIARTSAAFNVDEQIAQAVREHLEKEGWHRPQCEHDWYTDEKGFLICRKGCGE